MNASDPASLQNLNDIVMPEAASWWPLAAGWYVLIGFLLVTVAWFVFKSIKHRAGNRYRRAALRQLRALAEDIDDAERRDHALRQIPVLLKRTALSVYPRSQIASLTGRAWYGFLNARVGKPSFTDSIAGILEEITYSVGELKAVDPKTAEELIKACKHWLRHHDGALQGLER